MATDPTPYSKPPAANEAPAMAPHANAVAWGAVCMPVSRRRGLRRGKWRAGNWSP
jgi:hypothetical protein